MRRKSDGDLAQQLQEDDAVVPHICPPQFVDLSGLADNRYAIAESVLEAERQSCPNWMQKQNLQFEKDHGQLAEADDDDCHSEAEDDADGEVLCQCPIDLCARDAEKLDDYQFWFAQCREVLRVSRNTRKAKGFSPDHPLICVGPAEANYVHDNLKVGDVVYLLAKVAFSPFDASLVRLQLHASDLLDPDGAPSFVAKMHPTQEGLPDVITLDFFLKHLCENFDSENDRVQILHYFGGRKLGELDIKSMESIEQAVQSIVTTETVDEDDADLTEEQRCAKKRADFLKRALDAGKEKTKHAKAKPKSKQMSSRPMPKPQGVKKNIKQNQRKRSDVAGVAGQDANVSVPEDDGNPSADPDEPGLAGEVHRAIEQEWAVAFEAEMPQLPPREQEASSSSSVRPPENLAVQPAVEVQAEPLTLPWKDDSSGHCFLPKDGKPKGIHLGAKLSLLRGMFDLIGYFHYFHFHWFDFVLTLTAMAA